MDGGRVAPTREAVEEAEEEAVAAAAAEAAAEAEAEAKVEAEAEAEAEAATEAEAEASPPAECDWRNVELERTCEHEARPPGAHLQTNGHTRPLEGAPRALGG